MIQIEELELKNNVPEKQGGFGKIFIGRWSNKDVAVKKIIMAFGPNRKCKDRMIKRTPKTIKMIPAFSNPLPSPPCSDIVAPLSYVYKPTINKIPPKRNTK